MPSHESRETQRNSEPPIRLDDRSTCLPPRVSQTNDAAVVIDLCLAQLENSRQRLREVREASNAIQARQAGEYLLGCTAGSHDCRRTQGPCLDSRKAEPLILRR